VKKEMSENSLLESLADASLLDASGDISSSHTSSQRTSNDSAKSKPTAVKSNQSAPSPLKWVALPSMKALVWMILFGTGSFVLLKHWIQVFFIQKLHFQAQELTFSLNRTHSTNAPRSRPNSHPKSLQIENL
jgi:hypothetical protein